MFFLYIINYQIFIQLINKKWKRRMLVVVLLLATPYLGLWCSAALKSLSLTSHWLGTTIRCRLFSQIHVMNMPQCRGVCCMVLWYLLQLGYFFKYLKFHDYNYFCSPQFKWYPVILDLFLVSLIFNRNNLLLVCAVETLPSQCTVRRNVYEADKT